MDQTKKLNKALYSINEAYFLNEQKKKISDAELCIMYILDDGQLHSQIKISREWFIPKTTVNSIVGRWVEKGYIVASPIPGKRREQSIVFTDAGKEFAQEYLSIIYQAERLAIIFECGGTYFMKVSDGFSHLWSSLACLVLYAACFIVFSKALQGIPLSVAYASWGALGIIYSYKIQNLKSLYLYSAP